MQLNYMSADHFFCGFKLFFSLKLHGLFSRFFISSYVPVFISALDSLSRKQAGILKSESPDSFVYLRAESCLEIRFMWSCCVNNLGLVLVDLVKFVREPNLIQAETLHFWFCFAIFSFISQLP